MSLKKFLSILLILCLTFGIIACSKKVDNDDNGDPQTSASQENPQNSNNSDDENPQDIDNSYMSGDDIGIDVFSNYDEVSLPINYPKDEYPIYKDARVYQVEAREEDGMGTFVVNAISKDDTKKVSKFYFDMLKEGADEFNDYTSDLLTLYSGIYKGYKFTFNCSPEYSNDKYSLLSFSLEQIPTIEDVLVLLNEGEIPEHYPVSNFPLVDGSAIKEASESESDGVYSFSIYAYTDKNFKEILAYFEEAIGEITEKSKSSSTDSFSLSGYAHDYEFDIGGVITEKYDVELVEYWIYLYEITE